MTFMARIVYMRSKMLYTRAKFSGAVVGGAIL